MASNSENNLFLKLVMLLQLTSTDFFTEACLVCLTFFEVFVMAQQEENNK